MRGVRSMSARTKTVLLALATLVGVLLITNSPANSAGSYSAYGDVRSDAYYADAVAWMRARGITTGVTPGCFGPDTPVTRAQFVVLLWRTAGEPKTGAHHGFADVHADWQQEAVSWATKRGITTGTSPTTFTPDAPISRGDLVTMMWRWKRSQTVRTDHNFVDVSLDYQQDAVSWAVARGITEGTAPRRFSPAAATSRAEAAVLIWRQRGEPDVGNVPKARDCTPPAPPAPPPPAPGSGGGGGGTPATPGSQTTPPGGYTQTPGPAPAGHDANLAMITGNSATFLHRLDTAGSPNRNTPQSQLNINDYVVGRSGQPNSGVKGIWHTRCAVSHYAYDDPIVYPNQPGVSHLHMFFGNTDANAYSNNSTINNRGASSCGRDELNRTAYWIPALFDGANNVIPADQITVYYRNNHNTQAANVFPPGLRMIAGPGGSSEAIYWQCGHFENAREGGGGSSGPSSRTIPNCPANQYSHVQANIVFPKCWDGRNLDSADHRSHMSHAAGDLRNGSCPASHPVELPQIKLRVMFSTSSSSRPTSQWHLSSDNPGSANGASLHADWWGGWHPETNRLLAQNCLAQSRNCGSHELGDGRVIHESQRKHNDAPIAINQLLALCPTKSGASSTRDLSTCR